MSVFITICAVIICAFMTVMSVYLMIDYIKGDKEFECVKKDLILLSIIGNKKENNPKISQNKENRKIKYFVLDTTSELDHWHYQEVFLNELKCMTELKDMNGNKYIITLDKIENDNMYFVLTEKEIN